MKIFKLSLIPFAFCCVVFFSSAPFSSCTKTETEIVHDTVKIIVRDTIIKTDTLYDIKTGLIAYFNFNKGTLNDSSGLNNHIVLNNGATKTVDRFGKADNAYLFNGAGNFMRVANSASLSPANITMMSIVKVNGFYKGDYRQNQILIKGYKDEFNGIYGLRVGPTTGDCCTTPLDSTKEAFFGYYGNYGSTVGTFDPTSYVEKNKWIAVVVTYDGFRIKIYVDGVLKNTSLGSPFYNPNPYDLLIGGTENATYPYWFNGAIDEIRIYNRALSEEAVKQLSKLKE